MTHSYRTGPFIRDHVLHIYMRLLIHTINNMYRGRVTLSVTPQWRSLPASGIWSACACAWRTRRLSNDVNGTIRIHSDLLSISPFLLISLIFFLLLLFTLRLFPIQEIDVDDDEMMKVKYREWTMSRYIATTRWRRRWLRYGGQRICYIYVGLVTFRRW